MMRSVDSQGHSTAYDFGTGIKIEWSTTDSKDRFIPWKNVNGVRSPLTFADKIPAEDVESKSGKFSKVDGDISVYSEDRGSPATYFFRTRGGLLLYFKSSKEMMPIGAFPLLHCSVTVPEFGATCFQQDLPAAMRGTRSKDSFELKLSRDGLFCTLFLFPNVEARDAWEEHLLRYIEALNRSSGSAKSLFEYAASVSSLDDGIHAAKKKGAVKSRLDAKDSFAAFGGSKKWVYLNWDGPPSDWSLLLSGTELPSDHPSRTGALEKHTSTGCTNSEHRRYALADIAHCSVGAGGDSFIFYLKTPNYYFEPYLMTPVLPTHESRAAKSLSWVQGLNAACALRIQLMENAESLSPAESSAGAHFREKFLLTERNVARRGSKKRSSQLAQLPDLSDILASMPADEAQKIRIDQSGYETENYADKTVSISTAEHRRFGKTFMASLWGKRNRTPAVEVAATGFAERNGAHTTRVSTEDLSSEMAPTAKGKRGTTKSSENDDNEATQSNSKTIFGTLGIHKPAVKDATDRRKAPIADPRRLFVPPPTDTISMNDAFADFESNEDSPSHNSIRLRYWQNADQNDLPQLMQSECDASEWHDVGILLPPSLGSRKQVISSSHVPEEAKSGKEWENNPSRLSNFFGVFSSSRYSSELSAASIVSSLDSEDADNLPNIEAVGERDCKIESLIKTPPLSRGMSGIAQESRGNMIRITEEDNCDIDDESIVQNSAAVLREEALRPLSVHSEEIPHSQSASITEPAKRSLFRSVLNAVVGVRKKDVDDHKQNFVKPDPCDVRREQPPLEVTHVKEDLAVGSHGVESTSPRFLAEEINPANRHSPLHTRHDDDSSSENSNGDDDAVLGPISPHATGDDVPIKSGFFRNIFKSDRQGGTSDVAHTFESQSSTHKVVSAGLVKSNSFGKKRSNSLRDFGELVIPGGDGDVVDAKKESFFSSPAARRASYSSASLTSFSSPKGPNGSWSDFKLDRNLEEWEHAAMEREKSQYSSGGENLLNAELSDTLKADINDSIILHATSLSKEIYDESDRNANRSSLAVQNELDKGLTGDLRSLLSGSEYKKGIVSSGDVENSTETKKMDVAQSGEVVKAVICTDINYNEQKVILEVHESGEETNSENPNADFSANFGLIHLEKSILVKSYASSKLKFKIANTGSSKGVSYVAPSNSILAGLGNNDCSKPNTVSQQTATFLPIIFYGDNSVEDDDEWFSGDVTDHIKSKFDPGVAEYYKNDKIRSGISIEIQTDLSDSFLNDIQRECRPIVPSSALHANFLNKISSPRSYQAEENSKTPSSSPYRSQVVEETSSYIGKINDAPTYDSKISMLKLPAASNSMLATAPRLGPTLAHQMSYSAPSVYRTARPKGVRARHFINNPNVANRPNDKRGTSAENSAPNVNFDRFIEVDDKKSHSTVTGSSTFIAGLGKYLFSEQDKSHSEVVGIEIDSESHNKAAVARQQKREIIDLLQLAKRNATSQVKSKDPKDDKECARPSHSLVIGPSNLNRERTDLSPRRVRAVHEYNGNSPPGSKKQQSVFAWWDQPPSNEFVTDAFSGSDYAKSELISEKAAVQMKSSNAVEQVICPEAKVEHTSPREAIELRHLTEMEQTLEGLNVPSATKFSEINGTNKFEENINRPANCSAHTLNAEISYEDMSKVLKAEPNIRPKLQTQNYAVRRESLRSLKRSADEEHRLTAMRHSLMEKRVIDKKKSILAKQVNNTELNSRLDTVSNSVSVEENVEYILKAQYRGTSVSLYLGIEEIYIRHNDTGQFSTLLYSGIKIKDYNRLNSL